MKNPVVSVIIPTYNREKLLVTAINSVLNQTFKDFEILVIDDASTDNTKEVIDNFKNERISYYKLDKNSGQCVARNYGIKRARGKYIAFLDSDDRWLPEKLEKQINIFKNSPNKLGCVYGYAYEKDVIKDVTTFNKVQYFRGYIYNKFLEKFCPPTPSIFLVKTDAILKENGFDENLITFVDLDMWLRLSKNNHFDYVDEPVIIKYENIGDQYVNNFEKRYKGYKLFIDKWKNELLEHKGKAGLHNIKKGLVGAIVVPVLEHPPDNLRKFTPKILKLLFSVRSIRIRLYLKTLFILLFGPNIIFWIRSKKNKV